MFFAPPHFFGAFFFEDSHFSGRHITRSLSLLRWYEWLTKPGLVASCHWRQCNSNESFKFPCYYNRFSMILPIFTTQVLSSSTTHLRFNTHTHTDVLMIELIPTLQSEIHFVDEKIQIIENIRAHFESNKNWITRTV